MRSPGTRRALAWALVLFTAAAAAATATASTATASGDEGFLLSEPLSDGAPRKVLRIAETKLSTCNASHLAFTMVTKCVDFHGSSFKDVSGDCCDAFSASVRRTECYCLVMKEPYFIISSLSKQSSMAQVSQKCGETWVSPTCIVDKESKTPPASPSLPAPQSTPSPDPASCYWIIISSAFGWFCFITLAVIWLLQHKRASTSNATASLQMGNVSAHPNGVPHNDNTEHGDESSNPEVGDKESANMQRNQRTLVPSHDSSTCSEGKPLL